MEANARTRDRVPMDFTVEEGGVGISGGNGDDGTELGEEGGHIDQGDQVAMAHKWKKNDVKFIIFREHHEGRRDNN